MLGLYQNLLFDFCRTLSPLPMADGKKISDFCFPEMTNQVKLRISKASKNVPNF